MSHRDTDQPRVDRDLLDQLVRENGLTPDYINDAERQDREAAREWLNESVFDWMLPEHEIQLAHEGSGGGGHWDGSMPVRIHTFDGECNGSGAAALRAAQAGTWEGSVACATGRRSLRRGGTLAGEASGGGRSECGGCPGNALRWLP